jgi:hypothetical protein
MTLMIRKNLLQSLMGRTVADATQLAKAEGHQVLVMSLGTREYTLNPAPGNTIVLWQETEGVVRMAQAANPAELQDPGFYVP